MKNYINDYYGKKIPQDDGTITVELYEKDEVKKIFWNSIDKFLKENLS